MIARGRKRASRTALIVAAALGGALGAAPTATAGEFPINVCLADRGGFSTAAFDAFGTRGMKIKRACDPHGRGLRGLVVANLVRAGRVRRGARAVVALSAPGGTRFVRFRWSGEARRRDCRYALQLYADGPGIRPVPLKNVRANRRCPRPRRAQSAGWPRPRTFAVAGATRIVQRVVCVGSRRRRSCSARGLNYIRTFAAQATVGDDVPPIAAVLPDTPLGRGDWVRGAQALRYTASDNAGVRLARALFGGSARASGSRPCDFAARAPCRSGPGDLTVDTKALPEGSQAMAVQVEDAGGNLASSPPVTARIDNTPPGRVDVAVDGGQGWHRANGFDLGWANPPEPDRAPITAAHYRLCRAGTESCSTGTRQGTGVSRIAQLMVPGPGEWSLALWRQDAAANQEQDNASVPVTLRFDPDPPQLGFERSPADDPTLVSVLTREEVSGLGGGQVELSRQGSGSWQALDTRIEGQRVVARIDDYRLPPGTYLLRARAQDRAGNEASTDRRLDGQPVVMTLPLRVATAMRAGVVRERKLRRRGKRRRSRRRVTVLAPRARVRLGRRVRIAGRLTNLDGRPLVGVQVYVGSRSATAAERPVAIVRTNKRGRYSYTARASSSRVLRFAYAGTGLVLPVEREVVLLVPSRSTIAVSRRRARNGQSVVFRGRLRALPPPPGGKLVELQVRVRRRWQTFRTARSDPRGRWRIRYRFTSTRGLQRYRFRARLPAEAGYPFEAGASSRATVRVRGRG